MENFHCDGHDLGVAGVESGLDWDDELGDNGEDLGAALLQHVKHALNREVSIWVFLFADAFEENGQVVVVVELLHINFPVNRGLRAVINLDG
mgnify:CR=1 FL=1